MRAVRGVPAQDLDRPRTAEDRLPPHPDWMRLEAIDWDEPRIWQVLDAMPEDTHLLTAKGFLPTPQTDLDLKDGRAGRPVEWLVQGRDPAPVLALAAALDKPI